MTVVFITDRTEVAVNIIFYRLIGIYALVSIGTDRFNMLLCYLELQHYFGGFDQSINQSIN